MSFIDLTVELKITLFPTTLSTFVHNVSSAPASFNEYNQNFVDDIEMISLSIELEDKEMISDAIKAMAANCSTCHKKFRN